MPLENTDAHPYGGNRERLLQQVSREESKKGATNSTCELSLSRKKKCQVLLRTLMPSDQALVQRLMKLFTCHKLKCKDGWIEERNGWMDK